MEELLRADPPMPQEAWQRLKVWYKAAVDRAPLPARATLERVTAERMDLYCYVPYPGNNIPLSVKPFPLDDPLPTEDKIEEVVKNIRRNRFGEPSGMRDEHLKGWVAASNMRYQETAEEGKCKTDDEEGGLTKPHC